MGSLATRSKSFTSSFFKAISSIYTQSVHERNILSVTMPMSTQAVEKAGDRIRNFIEAFCGVLVFGRL